MRYADLRDQIKDGDLIAVRSNHGVLPALTRMVTRSPYTHTGVALWDGCDGVDRLLIAQENGGGCSIAPLSQFADTDFDVFDCPVARPAVKAAIWTLLGRRIGYDFGDLVRIAANRLLGIPLPPADDQALVCSALSAAIYRLASWSPQGLPSIPAPDDVVAAIGGAPKLEARP